MKQEFTIPIECPEGYLPIAFRELKLKDKYLSKLGYVHNCTLPNEAQGPRLIVQKIEPRTKTFVCISEELRCGLAGEYYETNHGKLYAVNEGSTAGVYKIWKEVKE